MSERESTHLSEAQLDDLADGLLDPDARARATAHLAQCARCNRDLNATRELLRWSGQARSAVRAPAELWPLVAASTMHVAAVRRQALRGLRGVLVAGALALVAATALVTWQLARASAGPSPSTGTVAPHRPHRPHATPSLPSAPQAPAAPPAPSQPGRLGGSGRLP